jgi:hypothetical protein
MKMLDEWRARWRDAERNFVPTPLEQTLINVVAWTIVSVKVLFTGACTVIVLYLWYTMFR